MKKISTQKLTEENQSLINETEHFKKFVISNSSYKIFLEIDYIKKRFKILPKWGGNFCFIGSDLLKWKIINQMIKEAIEFVEKEMENEN